MGANLPKIVWNFSHYFIIRDLIVKKSCDVCSNLWTRLLGRTVVERNCMSYASQV